MILASPNTLTESSSSGTTTYSWDARNRLIEATTPNGTLLFGYDINGIRTSRSEGGVTTNFVVDHNQQYAQVLAEIENGFTTRQYTYGDDLLSQSEGAGQERFFLYDGLGTTRALADGSEAVTDTYAYEAFGELLDSTGGSDNAYRYTGEQYDSGLNQYYLRARYYDQGVGRFTQMDIWMGRSQDPITLNKYVYANADPVRYVDPSGYFGLMDVLTAVRAQGTLTTIASRGGANAAGRRLVWNGACFMVEAMSEAAISQAIGLYVFEDVDIGKPYVGQSKANVVKRLQSHFRSTRTYVDKVTAILPVSVADGVSDNLSDVLDALEQSFIDDLDGPGGSPGQQGGSANKRNQVDVTKEKRRHLKKLMGKFKICGK